MPALITHYLFGKEALNRGLVPGMCKSGGVSDAERQAYLLGCQGPDPFFFGVTTPRGTAVRGLGQAMHRMRMSRAFDRLRSRIPLLPEEDRGAGGAFVHGLLAHYALDRVAHPYVYAMEHELCDGNPGLEDAHSEVHALIESEIDCGMLDLYRGVGTAQFHPAEVIRKNPPTTRAAGTLLADVAGTVFGLRIRPTDYGGAVDDMRLCYQMIEPYGAGRVRRLGGIERSVRSHSLLAALSHRTDLGAGNASMNPAKRAWTDPFKGGASTESFGEVFERALTAYGPLAASYAAGIPAHGIVSRVDYSGRVLDEQEEGARE